MRRRLLAGYVALAAFVLAVLAVPLGIVAAREERSRLVAAVQRDATILAGLAEDAVLNPAADTAAAARLGAVARAYATATDSRVVVVDAAGTAVLDTGEPELGEPGVGRDLSTRPEVAAALRGDTAAGTRFSTTLGEGLLYVAVPVSAGGPVLGAVRTTYPTAALDARIRARWVVLGGVALVVLLAAGVVGVALARSLGQPLARLEAAAERLAAGELAARAAVDRGPQDVRRLAATFDAMAERLDELVASQRAFVADASHQLRTPLTALRLRLENLADDVPPAARADVDAAVSEVQRLARLVDGLLVLLRAERAPAELVDVDAAAVADERVAAWRGVADEAEVGLRRTGDGAGVQVRAGAGALEQVLDNLIANAVRAAPPGSAVTVTVARRDHDVELRVIDAGPGMTPAQRASATERFWRGPGSSAGDGFGLGLAIVRRLVEGAGGSLALEAAPGGGLTAVVTLPAVHA